MFVVLVFRRDLHVATDARTTGKQRGWRSKTDRQYAYIVLGLYKL